MGSFATACKTAPTKAKAMGYSISILNTFPSVLPVSGVEGFVFKGGSIWIGRDDDLLLEQMDELTGAIIADHNSNLPLRLVLYDPVADQFWATPEASLQTIVARFDGSGNILSNPTVGLTPAAQCVANGSYWTANADGASATKLDSTGAFIATVPGLPAAGNVFACIYDGVGSIWIPATNNSLYQIDEPSATLVATFNPPAVAKWQSMILVAGNLWAIDGINANLVQMDLAGNVLNLFPVFTGGRLAFDGANFWMMDFNGTIGVYSSTGIFRAAIVVANPLTNRWMTTDGALPSGGFSGGTPNQAWATSGISPGVIQQFELVFTPPPVVTTAFPGTYVGFTTAGKFGGGSN